MIILLAAVVLFCLYWMFWIAKTRRIDKATASLPSPPALPIVGHAKLFLGTAEKILKNLEDLGTLAAKHVGTVKIWVGPKLYIAIANPEDAQVILENCLEKDDAYRFLRPLLGSGLFVASLGLWKLYRKVTSPVFHNKIIEKYLDVIFEQANILTDRLKEQSGQEKFDVLQYITACTLDIIFEMSVEEKMDVQHSPNIPYMRARNTVMKLLNMRIYKAWFHPDWLFNLTKYSKEQKDNIELMHKLTEKIIRKRRLEYETKKIKYNNDGNIKSMLDILFGSEIDLTDEQLREFIDSITIAGNDTTALVIAYTLMLLGIHQDIQEKVFREQQLIFDQNGEVTKEKLQKMHYLERVIKESMRIYTVVPTISRNVDRDIYLPYVKMTIPKGVNAIVGAFAIHRSERVWGENAKQFDPDRFLPERSVDRHPAAYLPFSYGPRNCLGRNLGMMMIKTIISSVIRSYIIESDEVGPLKLEILVIPSKGHKIKIRKRVETEN